MEAGVQRAVAKNQELAKSIQTVSTGLQTMAAQGKEAMQIYVTATDAAARAGDRLGSGFEDVKRALNLQAATAKAGQDLERLRFSVESGTISQAQFERASSAMS